MLISTFICIVRVLLLQNSFKWHWQYMAVAGAGAEIIDKGGAGAEIDNFGFAKLKNCH